MDGHNLDISHPVARSVPPASWALDLVWEDGRMSSIRMISFQHENQHDCELKIKVSPSEDIFEN